MIGHRVQGREVAAEAVLPVHPDVDDPLAPHEVLTDQVPPVRPLVAHPHHLAVRVLSYFIFTL